MSEQTRTLLACPKCGSPLYRVHRRLLERVVSLIVPLRRYGCNHCGWSSVHVDVHRPPPQFKRQYQARAILIITSLIVIVSVAVSIALFLKLRI